MARTELDPKAEATVNGWKKLLGLALGQKRRWMAIVGLLAIAAIAVTLGPLFLAQITNAIVGSLTAGTGIDWEGFYYWGAWSLLTYVIAFLSRWISDFLAAKATASISYRLRQSLEEKLWTLPLNYYDTHQRGDLMSRISNDIDNIITALNSITNLFYNAISLVGIIVVMLVLSWPLAILTLCFVPLSFFTIGKIGGMSRPEFIDQSRNLGILNANIEESFNGHELIKAYQQEALFIERFKGQNRALFFSSVHAGVLSGIMSPTSRFVTNLIYIAVAIFGAIGAIEGVLTIGDIQAFIQYSRQLSQPFLQIAQGASQFQMGLASLMRIDELLDEPNEVPEEAGALAHKELTGQMDFKDVSFSYVPERPLIEAMNLSVKPGETVAIVGETGAGKTTLVNLIERFYEINSGQILLDGTTDLHAITREALRENIGMVLQDTWLYEGTIEENIRYGIPEGREVSEEEFLEACRATFVDQFVRTKPEGYQTIVTNEQTSLSAGEKQLITIARAFVMRPNILILDEATSSVDTRTESLIQEAINKLREGRTSFIIAHRLSTIRGADIILVMKDGSIVEQGNHEELLAKGGAYAKLYRSQFGEAEPTNDPDVVSSRAARLSSGR